MDYWKGKTAIVTGAGSGIGRALASALTSRDAIVVATDLKADAATNVSALDVCDAPAFQAVADDVVRRHGRLDFLFNNAGIAVAGEAQEIMGAHWARVLDVNVGGTVNGVLAAYPIMVKQRSGHIVNIASLAGLGPSPLLVPYGTSKHAIVGLSTSLRCEAVHYGVRVSAVCPAAIETPLMDKDNPADLPAISWHPDMRRFLTRIGGAPYPVDRFADEALRGVEKNKAVIVIPGRARLAWRLGRLAPRLVERIVQTAVAAERKLR